MHPYNKEPNPIINNLPKNPPEEKQEEKPDRVNLGDLTWYMKHTLQITGAFPGIKTENPSSYQAVVVAIRDEILKDLTGRCENPILEVTAMFIAAADSRTVKQMWHTPNAKNLRSPQWWSRSYFGMGEHLRIREGLMKQEAAGTLTFRKYARR